MARVPLPPVDLQRLRRHVSNTGYTAAGFAVLAAKKALDTRNELAERHPKALSDVRKGAIATVETAETVRTAMAETLSPIVGRFAERLPDRVGGAIIDARDTAHSLQERAYDLSRWAIDLAIPADLVDPKPSTTAKEAPTAEAMRSSAEKPATNTKKPSTKKPSTKKPTPTKPAVKKPSAKKPSGKKPVAKPRAAGTPSVD